MAVHKLKVGVWLEVGTGGVDVTPCSKGRNKVQGQAYSHLCSQIPIKKCAGALCWREPRRAPFDIFMHIVGLLADTHGLLEQTVLSTFRSAKCTHILHAGDVTDNPKNRISNMSGELEDCLSIAGMRAKLEEVAPVSMVRGNTDDKYAPGHGLPHTLRWTCSGVRFTMHHGDTDEAGNDWKKLDKKINKEDHILTALRPADGWRPKGDLIVSGHSHDPSFVRHASGVHFLNPGSAGKQRSIPRKLPRQFAIVRCEDDGGIDVSTVDLITGETRAWAATGGDGAGDGGDNAAGAASPPPTAAVIAGASTGKRRKRPADDSPSDNTGGEHQPSLGGKRRGVGGGGGGSGVTDRDKEEEAGILLGTVDALFLKTARGAPMAASPTIQLQSASGIAGDVHATALSPRQVLLHGNIGGGSGISTSPGAMRENIHVRFNAGGVAAWPPPSGSVLRLGSSGAALCVSFACEPCAKGATSAGVDLTALSQRWKARASRGLLTTALRSGEVSIGDEVRMLTSEKYAPLASEHPQRVRQIIGKIPPGKVLPWTLLAQYAGAPTGFAMRGMPGLLKAAVTKGSPAWRVLDSKWRCPQSAEGKTHVPGQYEKLRGEGCFVREETGEVEESESVQWRPEQAELYWEVEEAPGE